MTDHDDDDYQDFEGPRNLTPAQRAEMAGHADARRLIDAVLNAKTQAEAVVLVMEGLRDIIESTEPRAVVAGFSVVLATALQHVRYPRHVGPVEGLE